MRQFEVLLYRVATIVLLMSLPAAFFLFLFSIFLSASVNFIKRVRTKLDVLFLFAAISIGLGQMLHSFSTRVQVPDEINWGYSLADMVYRLALIPGTGGLMFSAGEVEVGGITLLKLAISFMCLVLLLISLIRLWSLKSLVISYGSLIGIVCSLYFIPVAGILVQLKDFTNYYFSFPTAHARYFVTASFAFFLVLILVLDYKRKTPKDRIVLGLAWLFVPIVFVANFSLNPSRAGPDFPSQAETVISECAKNTTNEYRIFVSPFNGQWFFDYDCDWAN
jgi:hypothetical protein